MYSKLNHSEVKFSMKNLFKPFSAESLLVALGLTFISYIITPIAKEIFRQVSTDDKKIHRISSEAREKFVAEKGSL